MISLSVGRRWQNVTTRYHRRFGRLAPTIIVIIRVVILLNAFLYLRSPRTRVFSSGPSSANPRVNKAIIILLSCTRVPPVNRGQSIISHVDRFFPCINIIIIITIFVDRVCVCVCGSKFMTSHSNTCTHKRVYILVLCINDFLFFFFSPLNGSLSLCELPNDTRRTRVSVR